MLIVLQEIECMNVLDDLFRFPIVMVDGDNEDRKSQLGLPGEDELDIIIGEAECPYADFISITDRWLPTQQSFDRALNRKFDACFVVFGGSGSFVVPWNKKRFKEELQKFIDEQPTEKTHFRSIGKDELIAIAQQMPDEEDVQDSGK